MSDDIVPGVTLPVDDSSLDDDFDLDAIESDDLLDDTDELLDDAAPLGILDDDALDEDI